LPFFRCPSHFLAGTFSGLAWIRRLGPFLFMFHFDGFSRLEELDVEKQRVFVRADLDCPSNAAGDILDDSKIQAAATTLKYLLAKGAQVVVGAHRGPLSGQADPKWSLEPCGAKLADLLKAEVFLPEKHSAQLTRKLISELRPGGLVLLENLAFEAGEVNGDEAFARTLAEGIDLYVADALECPPQLASIALTPRISRDRTLGLRAESELVAANRLLRAAPAERVLVVGGEFGEHTDLLNWALRPSQTVIVGGNLANTLLAAQGANLQRTEVDARLLPEARAWLTRARNANVRVILPRDVRVVGKTVSDVVTFRNVSSLQADDRIVDVGPDTLSEAAAAIGQARALLVVGAISTDGAFTDASRSLLDHVARASAFSVICNTAVNSSTPSSRLLSAPLAERMGFVSTAGSAFISIICGKQHAGLELLRSAN
jgi:phosphoglycerate kinase